MIATDKSYISDRTGSTGNSSKRIPEIKEQIDGKLIAGQRRLKACKELGWREIQVNVINLGNILRGEHDENAVRKDLLPSEAVAMLKRWTGRAG